MGPPIPDGEGALLLLAELDNILFVSTHFQRQENRWYRRTVGRSVVMGNY